MEKQIKDSNVECTNCGKHISIMKIDLHESYCLKNIVKCEICQIGIEKSEHQKHLENHQNGSLEQQDQHLKYCCFCDSKFQQDKIDFHKQTCGEKTVKCCVCDQKIQRNNYDQHLAQCLTSHQDQFPEYENHIKEQKAKEEIKVQQEQDIKEGNTFLTLFHAGTFIKLKKQDQQNFEYEKLKFITYNVWFEPHNFIERNSALRNIFKQYKPDFICLQEVTEDFLQLLIKDLPIIKNYHIPNISINGYGVLILSRRPGLFEEISYQKYTNMGRSILIGRFRFNGQEFTIGTTHFESLNNGPLRQKQMEIAFNELKKYENSILMGDFNFDSKMEDDRIPDTFEDIWPTLHQKSLESYTMKKSGRYRAWRPDRICLKKQENWKATKIERIGMEPIDLYNNKPPATQYEIVTPSDHFGLYAEITFNKKC